MPFPFCSWPSLEKADISGQYDRSSQNMAIHTGTEVGGRRAYLFKYKFLIIAMQGKFGQKVFGITLEVINQCISAL